MIKAIALSVLVAVSVGIFAAMATGEILQDGRIQRLESENAALRTVNARHAAISKLEAGAPPDIDMVAVKNASFDMGIPASLLVAVRRMERGSQGYELGNKAKTEVFAACVPVDQWQYYEASRSLNRLVWKWALGNPIYRRDLFKSLGQYTRADKAKEWSKMVERFQKEAQPHNRKGAKQ